MEVDVIETLMALRRDYGLTPGRIREVGQPLMDALGTSDADTARKMVADAIERMGRSRHALVLAASYGLGAGDAVTSLATRQNRTAKTLNISVDTVKRDERRAISELHHLLFPDGEVIGTGPGTEDLISLYMNVLEYISFDAHNGQGSFDVVGGARFHAGDRSHIPGTPSDDEWRDEHFVRLTWAVRKNATAILACLAGWPVESLTLARPKVGPGVRICQEIDSALEIAHPGWNSVSALLHLRRWELFRSVDDGFVDLYVTPSAVHPWDGFNTCLLDEATTGKLMEIRDQILGPVTAIVQEVLQLPSLRMAYSGSVQVDDGMPVYGEGDVYRFRMVLMDNS